MLILILFYYNVIASFDSYVPRVQSQEVGAVLLGSCGNSIAFALAPSQAPISRLRPPALRTGRADFPHPALQVDHAAHSRITMLQYCPALYAHKGTLPADSPPSHGMRTGLATPRQHRRFDDPFTYACAYVGRSDILSQMLGFAIFRCPLSLLSALKPCGPFPQRALPPRLRYYGPLRHPNGPTCSLRSSGCRVT